MPKEDGPDWWRFDLELSLHVEERMIDRSFSEVDLRLMMENPNGLWFGGSVGRLAGGSSKRFIWGEAWGVVVEPDELEQVIIVITAYKVTAW
jgi:hypothetical protein